MLRKFTVYGNSIASGNRGEVLTVTPIAIFRVQNVCILSCRITAIHFSVLIDVSADKERGSYLSAAFAVDLATTFALDGHLCTV